MAGLVTLFGGGGFLGRYVAQELFSRGARVRFAERDPRHAWFLKPLGALGQSQFIAADVTNPRSITRAVAGSDVVINLVGILAGDFDAVHAKGAQAIARAAADAGAETLVHVSAIGADATATSAYARSKGEGEIAVRTALPAATILRPSILFGPEDGFVNRFARMAQLLPVLPVIRPRAKFQPAYVGDVARAITLATLEPAAHAAQTYQLGGPQVIALRDLIAWIAAAIGSKPALLDVPDPIAEAIARLGFLPGAPITRDQWLMLQHDNVVAPGAASFAAFGIDPVPLAAVGPGWLVRYRRHGRFAKDATLPA